MIATIAAWTTNSKPYYTHDGDWVLYLALAVFLAWVAWANWKDSSDSESEPFDYGFWDERPTELTKPQLYDWEKEGIL